MIREAKTKELWSFFQRVIKAEMKDQHPSLFDPGRLQKCNVAYVAEKDGEIVGAITLDFGNSTGRPEVATAYVRPDHGWEGIGSQLAEVAIRRMCNECPGKKVFCNVTTEGMHKTLNRALERLPLEMAERLAPDLSYQRDGDEPFPGEERRKKP